MGFLSGVLSNIKEHLGQHKGQITEAVKLLEDNKHLGKEGFNIAIGSVVEGVGRYNDNVKSSNEAVNRVINKLKSDMTNINNILKNSYETDDVGKIDKKVEECIRHVAEYTGGMGKGKNNIADLQKDLQNKINKAGEIIYYQATQLKVIHSRQQKSKEAVETSVTRKINNLRDEVKENIKKEVKSLVDQLKDKVKDILKELEKINDLLYKYVDELQRWIEKADKDVNTAIRKSSEIVDNSIGINEKTNIERTVRDIKEAFNKAKDFVKQKVEEAIQAVSKMDEELNKDLFTVKTQLNEGIKNVIEGVAGQVSSEIGKSGKAAVQIFKQAMEILHQQIGDMKSKQFDSLKRSVDGQLKTSGEQVNNKIATVISKYKSDVVETLSNLNTKVSELTVQLILAQADELEKRIDRQLEVTPETALQGEQKSGLMELTARVHNMKGNIINDPNRLQNIQRYQSQCNDIRNDVLSAIINANDAWQQEIHETLTHVQSQVSQHKTSLPQQPTTHDIQSIIDSLSEELDDLKKLAKCTGDDQWNACKAQWGNVRQQLFQLNEYLERMGTNVGGWISRYKYGLEQTVRNAQQICTQLQNEIQTRKRKSTFGYASGFASNQYSTIDKLFIEFDRQIKHQLDDIAHAAGVEKNGIKAQLDDLSKNISTLKNAIHRVEGHVTNVENALSPWINESSQKLTEAKQTADEAITALAVQMQQKVNGVIDKLKPKVEAQLKNGSTSSGVDINGSEGFSLYKSHVKQDPTTLSALASGNLDRINETSGTLPNKIKDIDTHGLTTLSNLLNGETSVSSRGFLDQITDNLTNLLKEFSTAGQYINKYLNELKTDIGKDKRIGLNEIKNKLKLIITGEVKAATKLATDFLNGADKLRDKYVSQIHQYVAEQSSCATRDINTQVCKQYVSIIQDLLSEFVNKVQSELSPLPKEITADAEKAYKGFMGVLLEKIKNSGLPTALDDSATLQTLSARAKTFFTDLPRTLKTKPKIMPSDNLSKLQNRLTPLFTDLTKYDIRFVTNLDALYTLLSDIRPESYAHQNNPLLQILKVGITDLHDELNNAYISAYDSETFNGELVKNVQHVSSTSDVNMKYDLTDEGTRLSKVFLTVLRTLDVSLHTLKSNCRVLPKKRINRDTDLGKLLTEMGYVVSNLDEQNGELQDKSEMTGEHILGRLIGHSKKVYSSHNDAREKGPLTTLCSHLEHYYDVCHQALRPKSRLPCNVNEMLVWFTGLPHHPVYEELIQNSLSAPFENQSKQTVVGDDGLELTLTDTRVESITAHPSNITYNSVNTALQHLCTKSRDLLTTVMGHGNAETVYAVDFHTNYFNLKYPTSGEECLQTILDILRRMLPPLRYLYYRCSVGTNHGGWAQCLYGRDIITSKWPCKNHSTDEPKCQPNDKVTCQPNCQPTSPLMSYLGDCLIGHLPHMLTTIGCRSVCSTCPSVSKLGMPCITPLGFRAFSGSTKTGRDIYEILRLLFGSGLVSSLLCLAPTPPSTLPEHFQFALALGNMLHNGESSSANGVSAAFRTSIENASIRLYENPTALTNAVGNAYGDTQADHRHTTGEPKHAPLSSLSMNQSCMLPKTDNIFCGPYLQSLYQDSYYSLAEKHCSVYLSWAIYLPWQFWNYLKTLYDSFCSISCQDWGCSGCLKGDECKTGKHGTDYNCRCWSVVKCRGVQSTFYNYGFTFGDAKKLLDEN